MLTDRFWPKVAVAGTDQCWEWKATRNSAGYGQIAADGGKPMLMAHRVAYEITFGSIPSSLVIDHRCANPGCVNPAHLDAVSQGENLRRGWARRPYQPRRSCDHDWSNPENVYVRGEGRLACRACRIERAAQANRHRIRSSRPRRRRTSDD